MGIKALVLGVLLAILVHGSAAWGRRILQNVTQDVSARLLNGNPADEGRFPYVVSLKTFFTQRHICGGVLVAPNVVLTAAHCVDEGRNSQAEAKPRMNIGGLARQSDHDSELRFTCKAILHPNWNGVIHQGNDLAAIILDQESQKQPINLDYGAKKGEGLKLTALGWGRTHFGSFADHLQRTAGFVLISNEQCNLPLVYNGLVKDTMVCADGGGADTCEGDSGGPLVFEEQSFGGDVLVGVTSFGPAECGSKRLPSVNTRISAYTDWIQQVIRDNPACSSDAPDTDNQGDEQAENTTDAGDCEDRRGIDLNGGLLPMNDGTQTVLGSSGECCGLCKKTQGCAAWTWIEQATQYNPKGACWMRDQVPQETKCDVCVSGAVKRDQYVSFSGTCSEFKGVDFKGSDRQNGTYTGSNAECCSLCQGREGCKAWTRTHQDGQCFLKFAVPEFAICSDCDSGVVYAKVSSEELYPIQSHMVKNAKGETSDGLITVRAHT